MTDKTYNDRHVRLECLKAASLLVTQRHGQPKDAVPLAEQFYQFVIGGDDKDDRL